MIQLYLFYFQTIILAKKFLEVPIINKQEREKQNGRTTTRLQTSTDSSQLSAH